MAQEQDYELDTYLPLYILYMIGAFIGWFLNCYLIDKMCIPIVTKDNQTCVNIIYIVMVLVSFAAPIMAFKNDTNSDIIHDTMIGTSFLVGLLFVYLSAFAYYVRDC